MEDIPFQDRYVAKTEIDWDRSWWWWYPVTRAIHPAMRVTSLLTGALGLLGLQLGAFIANWTFAPRFSESANEVWTWKALGSLRVAQVEIGQSRLFETLGLREFAFLTFSLLWFSAVFGLFGGIIARRAAVELGQRTIAPWGETLRLVLSRWLSTVWLTGMHLVALLCLLVAPFLLGLLARLGPLALVAGCLLMLCFPLVWAIGRLALSMLVCFPLGVSAIVIEKKADAFEGFSRSNACFFQRPVLTVMLVFAFAAIGVVGYQLVYWLFLVGWHWHRDAFLSGAGLSIRNMLDGLPSDSTVRAQRVGNWILAGGAFTRILIASFWFSYFWSATAAIYLILRKSVYNAELDDIDAPFRVQPSELPTLPASPEAKSPASQASAPQAAPPVTSTSPANGS